jgi:hypothetical protein
MGTNFPAVLKAKIGNIGYSELDGPGVVVNGTNISYSVWEQQATIVTNRLDVVGTFGVTPRSGVADTADLYVPLNVNTNGILANGGSITAFKDTNGLGGTLTANLVVGSSSGDQLFYANSTSSGSLIGYASYSNNVSMGGIRYNGAGGAWEIYDKTGTQRITFPDGGTTAQVPGAFTAVSGNITANSGSLVSSTSGDNILFNQTTGASSTSGFGFIRNGTYIFQTRINGANQWELIGTNSTVVVSAAPTGGLAIGASGAPTITSGSGAPSSSQPNGSLYLRTDGTGPNLYVRENGAWVSK